MNDHIEILLIELGKKAGFLMITEEF